METKEWKRLQQKHHEHRRQRKTINVKSYHRERYLCSTFLCKQPNCTNTYMHTWYIYRLKLVRRLWQWLWHHCIRTRYIKWTAAEISLSVHRAHFIWYFQNCILYYAAAKCNATSEFTILSCVFFNGAWNTYSVNYDKCKVCARFLFLLLGESTPHFS